jgi:hypothetical protein
MSWTIARAFTCGMTPGIGRAELRTTPGTSRQDETHGPLQGVHTSEVHDVRS